jgi:hypothetical protein
MFSYNLWLTGQIHLKSEKPLKILKISGGPLLVQIYSQRPKNVPKKSETVSFKKTVGVKILIKTLPFKGFSDNFYTDTVMGMPQAKS